MGVKKLSQHSTFGPPKEMNRTLPDGYLKKRTGEPTLPERTSSAQSPAPRAARAGGARSSPAASVPGRPSRTCATTAAKATSRQKPKMKMDVPSRTEKPVMGLVSDKNFVTANAVEVILSKPKDGKVKSTTSRAGEDSMRYTQKSDYGRVPQYLTTIKSKIADEKARIDEHIRMQQEAEMAQSQRLVKLSEEERQELLVGLKLKWAEVNEKSQKMTFTLDTPAKRQRKERYEEQLMQFEKDIEMLSRKNIYVEHGFY